MTGERVMVKKSMRERIRTALAAPPGAGERSHAAAAPSAETGVMARLAGGVAHDLNNILLVLQGYMEMAAEEAEVAPGLQGVLGEMRSATARAAFLVRDLLVIGGRGAFSPRLLDLSELVRKRLPALQASCPAGIEIQASLAEGLDPVRVDEEQVSRMLEALCARSRETMPSGGVVSVRTCRANRGGVILQVADRGAPLSAEIQARLFEPYLPGPGGGKGQGLGMPVVLAVVRRHGGDIEVRAQDDGTEIEVWVPAAVEPAAGTSSADLAPEAEEPPAAARESAKGRGAAGGAILLAEDDDGLRELAVKVLVRDGYTVLAARDGQEAVELFLNERRRIQLVVLDDVMPRLGGRAALERIHTVAPEVPLILCSGYDWRLTERSSGSEGAPRTLLSKPWQPRDLLKKVHEALERRAGAGPQENRGQEGGT